MKTVATLLALLALFACSYFSNEGEKITFLDHTEPPAEVTAHENHDHAVLEPIEWEGEQKPSVDLIVHTDPKSGWNLQVKTTNFRFAPERVSTEHIAGEGHGHIYVDGVKINRLYGEWYHIPTLSIGEHKIVVVLNSNDHFPYTVNGEKLRDEEIITVTVE